MLALEIEPVSEIEVANTVKKTWPVVPAKVGTQRFFLRYSKSLDAAFAGATVLKVVPLAVA